MDSVTNESSFNSEYKKRDFLIPFAIQLTVQISVSRKLEIYLFLVAVIPRRTSEMFLWHENWHYSPRPVTAYDGDSMGKKRDNWILFGTVEDRLSHPSREGGEGGENSEL